MMLSGTDVNAAWGRHDGGASNCLLATAWLYQHSRVTALVLYVKVVCALFDMVPCSIANRATDTSMPIPFHALGNHQHASLQANTRRGARMLSSVNILLLGYYYCSEHAIGAQHAPLLH